MKVQEPVPANAYVAEVERLTAVATSLGDFVVRRGDEAPFSGELAGSIADGLPIVVWWGAPVYLEIGLSAYSYKLDDLRSFEEWQSAIDTLIDVLRRVARTPGLAEVVAQADAESINVQANARTVELIRR